MSYKRDLLLESLGEAILQLDEYGNILYASPATARMTGYTERELLGKPFQILSNDPGDDFENSYQLSTAASRGTVFTQGWNRKSDGQTYWAETRFSPIFEQEKLMGFGCVVRDITERIQHELTLRENEERYRMLVEGVRDYSIFMLDPDGYILTWNEGGQRVTGYYAQEIIGKHFSVFYTSNDLADGKHHIELETAKGTGRYEEEGWRVKKNGSLYWANIVLTALYNTQNQLIGFSKVTKDLSDRNEELATLRQTEERYRLLVEQVTDYAIFMIDEKGRIVSWNEGAKRIKGYTADEVLGKYFSIFYPQEDIIKGKPAYELKVGRAEGKYEEEGWRLRKDGTRFWANVVITAIYNSEGILIGFSKVTRDLTERKKAEQAARQSSDKYRQIAVAMEGINTELKNTNQELEQFTSIVSHDLKEPLRTVTSFLHLIASKLDKGEVDELKSYVGKSLVAAGRMKDLIAHLLNYSQVSKGEIATEELSLRTLFDQVLQDLKGASDASSATIYIENQDVDVIQGDRIQLLQLFQNLISNAIKFAGEKNPIVKVTCTSEAGYLKFSVSDNGIGMEKNSETKIFEPFRRLHSARDMPGAGMGLAICKKVVERHNGRIWAQSTPGEGSTFYFTLWEKGFKSSLAANETI
jgi:PAS domain S-box-containing protein